MMKIKQLLLVFFIGVTFSVDSQTTPWINPGAVWYYKLAPGAMAGNEKIEYTHDTILNGKNCQVLQTTRSFYGEISGAYVFFYSQTWRNYTYNNGDTVFYLVDTAFEVLYNFGAQPGQTWDLGVDTNDSYCSKSIVHVDSVSTLNIGSNTHRVLYTSQSPGSSVVIGGIIEHIGAMSYLFPLGRVCDTNAVVEYYEFTFSCFSDATTNYSLVPPGECENPYHVGLEELKNELFTLSPNPTNGVFSLNFINHNGIKIVVFNSTGKICFNTKTIAPNISIDLSDLSNGLYLISVENEKGEKTFKKLVKN